MEGYCSVRAVAQAVSASRPFGQPGATDRERHDRETGVIDRVIDNLINEMRRAGIEVNPREFRRLAS